MPALRKRRRLLTALPTVGVVAAGLVALVVVIGLALFLVMVLSHGWLPFVHS